MPATKWILYDIGGVLEIVDDGLWQPRFVARWRERSGFTVEEYGARLDRAQLPAIDREPGTAQEYWRRVGIALEFDEAETSRMRTEMWDAYCGELNAGLMEHARSLSGRAGRAILSNSVDGAREEEERRYGFSAVFDPICYSHELGVAKPDGAVYRAVLDRLDAAPDDVLFIDDHQVAVDGAAAVGMRSILHRDNAATIAAIEEFLAGA